MRTSEALRKIFERPSEVFIALKDQPNWVGAIVVLLTVVVVQSAFISFSISRAYAQYEPSEAERERYEALMEEYREEIEAAQESARGGVVDVDGWAENGAVTETMIFTSPSGEITRFNLSIAALAFLIAIGIEVAYFRIVGSKLQLPFKTANWLAFTVWSRIPGTVLAFLGVLLVLLFSGYQANVANYEALSIVRWISSMLMSII